MHQHAFAEHQKHLFSAENTFPRDFCLAMNQFSKRKISVPRSHLSTGVRNFRNFYFFENDVFVTPETHLAKISWKIVLKTRAVRPSHIGYVFVWELQESPAIKNLNLSPFIMLLQKTAAKTHKNAKISEHLIPKRPFGAHLAPWGSKNGFSMVMKNISHRPKQSFFWCSVTYSPIMPLLPILPPTEI